MRGMYESQVIEEFALPEECKADYVTIDRDSDGQLHATPFVIRAEGVFAGSDRTWYHEPDSSEWSPTEKYRQAIEERSDHAIEEIETERQWTTHGYI